MKRGIFAIGITCILHIVTEMCSATPPCAKPLLYQSTPLLCLSKSRHSAKTVSLADVPWLVSAKTVSLADVPTRLVSSAKIVCIHHRT